MVVVHECCCHGNQSPPTQPPTMGWDGGGVGMYVYVFFFIILGVVIYHIMRNTVLRVKNI